MKTVWRFYQREIIWIAIITGAVGYLFIGGSAYAAREVDEPRFSSDWLHNTLTYGTGVWVALFVLVIGVVIPRKAYFADEASYVRPAKLFISTSDVLKEMREDDEQRRSRNFGMWGTDDDLPPM